MKNVLDIIVVVVVDEQHPFLFLFEQTQFDAFRAKDTEIKVETLI